MLDKIAKPKNRLRLKLALVKSLTRLLNSRMRVFIEQNADKQTDKTDNPHELLPASKLSYLEPE